MARTAIDIREFAEDDLEAVVAFSLRAWEPVFASVQAVLGDEIFLRLHPDWRTSQAETVRSICTNEERDVYVAAVGARPVGFVAVALDAFHERMGVIEIIGVDPDYQRQGVGARLTEFAADHMRRCWHGHCGGRNRRRPRARTGSCAVQRRGLHALADLPLLQVARLTRTRE